MFKSSSAFSKPLSSLPAIKKGVTFAKEPSLTKFAPGHYNQSIISADQISARSNTPAPAASSAKANRKSYGGSKRHHDEIHLSSEDDEGNSDYETESGSHTSDEAEINWYKPTNSAFKASREDFVSVSPSLPEQLSPDDDNSDEASEGYEGDEVGSYSEASEEYEGDVGEEGVESRSDYEEDEVESYDEASEEYLSDAKEEGYENYETDDDEGDENDLQNFENEFYSATQDSDELRSKRLKSGVDKEETQQCDLGFAQAVRSQKISQGSHAFGKYIKPAIVDPLCPVLEQKEDAISSESEQEELNLEAILAARSSGIAPSGCWEAELDEVCEQFAHHGFSESLAPNDAIADLLLSGANE